MYEGPEMSIMTLATADVPDLGKPKPDPNPSALNKVDNEVVTNQVEPDPGDQYD